MTEYGRSTETYLGRCHAGDRAAMEALLVRELPRIHREVERRVTSFVRRGESASDVVQEVIVRILERGPVLRTPTREDWRALLSRIIENTIIDRYRYHAAKRRDLAEQVSLDGLEQVNLVPAAENTRTPGTQAAQTEVKGLVAVALHLLPDLQRQVIDLRGRAQLDWAEIGLVLTGTDGTPRTPDAARMLYQRAVSRLGGILGGLQDGRISSLLAAAVNEREELS